MGWHEWPLILFTVIAQSAMGAFWWCFGALMFGGLDGESRLRLEKSMIAVWCLVGLGFAFAAFHLGEPFRFINASFRFGVAAFSNEVVFGSAFAAAGLATWYMAWRGIGTVANRKLMYWLTLLFSAGFLFGMSSFYLMPTVPTWNTPLTPMAYILTAIIGGSAVAATLFSRAGVSHGFFRDGPVRLAVVAVVAALLVTIAQSNGLASINSSIKQAAELTPNYAALMALRFVILFSTLALWFRQTRNGSTLSLQGGVLCVALLIIGEIVGRGVFYNLHMTVGLR
ncbi:dimethyl sulfoxide reductase anchor subunit family protein [Thauera sp. SDU_THAU2]|uniref:dimethyl sulfoxide reductase anchor subunit family protein n=1 Tax=Thauera sp. SDU_THAU2 TaxID=3136633 RepID=UPI00311DCCFC